MMHVNEIANFAEAASRPAGQGAAVAVPSYDRVAVLGGGVDARLFAALCLAEGAGVTLFSAYGNELEAMRSASGPVGTYQVDRADAPSVQLTAELDAAVRVAEALCLTGPVHKPRTYAMVLADHLGDGQVLVLAPGLSLGALETAWLLRIGGAVGDIAIVGAQAAPFRVEPEGAVLRLSPCGPVAAATLPRGRDDVLRGLARFLPNLDPRDSVLASGFADGSALVEFPPR